MVQRIPMCIAHLFFTAAGVMFLTCSTSNWLFFIHIDWMVKCVPAVKLLIYDTNSKPNDSISNRLILSNVKSWYWIQLHTAKCDLFFACSINNYNFVLILHFSGTNSDCWIQDINRILNLSFQASVLCSIEHVIDSTKSIFFVKFTLLCLLKVWFERIVWIVYRDWYLEQTNAIALLSSLSSCHYIIEIPLHMDLHWHCSFDSWCWTGFFTIESRNWNQFQTDVLDKKVHLRGQKTI